MKKLIATKELSELIGVTEVTIWRWRKEGMPFKKLGTRIRFEYDSVIEWLEKRGKNNE